MVGVVGELEPLVGREAGRVEREHLAPVWLDEPGVVGEQGRGVGVGADEHLLGHDRASGGDDGETGVGLLNALECRFRDRHPLEPRAEPREQFDRVTHRVVRVHKPDPGRLVSPQRVCVLALALPGLDLEAVFGHQSRRALELRGFLGVERDETARLRAVVGQSIDAEAAQPGEVVLGECPEGFGVFATEVVDRRRVVVRRAAHQEAGIPPARAPAGIATVDDHGIEAEGLEGHRRGDTGNARADHDAIGACGERGRADVPEAVGHSRMLTGTKQKSRPGPWGQGRLAVHSGDWRVVGEEGS